MEVQDWIDAINQPEWQRESKHIWGEIDLWQDRLCPIRFGAGLSKKRNKLTAAQHREATGGSDDEDE